MANHKSAAKRAVQAQKKRLRNRSYLSAVRTALKSAKSLSGTETDAETVQKSFQKAQSLLGKAAQKGLIKKNNASRKIQRLSKLLFAKPTTAAK